MKYCSDMQEICLFWSTAGVENKVGWAYGLGLERWAMKLYQIPDIRVFWSKDPGFLSQFAFDDPDTSVKFKVWFVCLHCTVCTGISPFSP